MKSRHLRAHGNPDNDARRVRSGGHGPPCPLRISRIDTFPQYASLLPGYSSVTLMEKTSD
jgi:hypothetical protein